MNKLNFQKLMEMALEHKPIYFGLSATSLDVGLNEPTDKEYKRISSHDLKDVPPATDGSIHATIYRQLPEYWKGSSRVFSCAFGNEMTDYYYPEFGFHINTLCHDWEESGIRK